MYGPTTLQTIRMIFSAFILSDKLEWKFLIWSECVWILTEHFLIASGKGNATR